MPEPLNGWLAQSGGALAAIAALMHGGFLGGLAVLVVMVAISVKTAGPELREWVTMMWARKDAKNAKPIDNPVADADMSDAV